MQTSALITLLNNEFPDWSRVRLLTYLNEIQNIIFTKSSTNQMRMYDSTTGLDPTITTTHATYEYYINTTNGFSYNAWRVGAVYSEDITDPEDVLVFDAQPGSAAKIVFKQSPGTATYYVRCYRPPVQLTTETVQLEVPMGYHLTHVYEGIVGLIEINRSGKSERWEKFQRVLLPELITKMSEAVSIYNVTPKGY